MSGERIMYEGKYSTLHILEQDALATFGYSNLDGLASWQETYPRGGNRVFVLTEFQANQKAVDLTKIDGLLHRMGLAEGEIGHLDEVNTNRNVQVNVRVERLEQHVAESLGLMAKRIDELEIRQFRVSDAEIAETKRRSDTRSKLNDGLKEVANQLWQKDKDLYDRITYLMSLIRLLE